MFQDLQKILSLLEYDPRRATFGMIDVDIKSMKDKIDNTLRWVCTLTESHCM